MFPQLSCAGAGPKPKPQAVRRAPKSIQARSGAQRGRDPKKIVPRLWVTPGSGSTAKIAIADAKSESNDINVGMTEQSAPIAQMHFEVPGR
jgi:hypothetical protein